MNFSGRPHFFATNQSHDGPHPGWVSSRTAQSHAQSWPSAQVLIELGFRPVLRHHQVEPPIPIIITNRRAPLLAIDLDSTLLARDRLQAASTVPPQPQSPP